MSAGPNEVLNMLADAPHSYLNDRATVCEFEMTVIKAIVESTPTYDGVHPSRAA